MKKRTIHFYQHNRISTNSQIKINYPNQCKTPKAYPIYKLPKSTKYCANYTKPFCKSNTSQFLLEIQKPESAFTLAKNKTRINTELRKRKNLTNTRLPKLDF